MVVRDVVVVKGTSDQAARAACPAGYTRVPVDLNQGAGGRWIYLCYSTAGDAPPIVAMALSFSSDSRNQWAGPACATRLPVDLNMGAGGDWIHLWYVRRGADTSTIPSGMRGYFTTTDAMLSLQVVARDQPVTSLPGWTRVAGYRAQPPYASVDPDLNRGAGGKYIYLFFQRQIPLVMPH